MFHHVSVGTGGPIQVKRSLKVWQYTCDTSGITDRCGGNSLKLGGCLLSYRINKTYFFSGGGSSKSSSLIVCTNKSSDFIRSFCTPDGAMYILSLKMILKIDFKGAF